MASVEECENPFFRTKYVAPNDAQDSNSKNKGSRIKKTLANQVNKCYFSRVQCQVKQQRSPSVVLLRRRGIRGIEHVTDSTRKNSESTKPRQEKAESKQVIHSQNDTEALSDNSTIKYKSDHCAAPPQKGCEHK